MKIFKFPFFITALLLLFGQSLFAHDFEANGIFYDITSSEDLTIEVADNDYYGSYSGDVVIPASITYNGTTYSVTSIGNNAFYNNTDLTSIEIPSSVTSIGEYAFYECTGLTNIEIPSSVTSIGEYAFYGCTGLTSIEIPDGVTNIEVYAFQYCTGLTSIEIPSSVTSISDYVFSGCTGLTSIRIPSGVTSIGGGAFSKCTGLTSIEISNSVTSIGNWAFSGCTGLTSIEIPNSVTSIGGYAFSSCTALMHVTIYNTFTRITNGVFDDCPNLVCNEYDNACYLGNPNDLYLILIHAKSENIISCTIHPNCKYICSYAFKDCSQIKDIYISENVLYVCQGAFSGFCGIVHINSNLFYIKLGAPVGPFCSTKAKSFILGDNVLSIGQYTFAENHELTSVYIGKNMNEIGYGCSSFYGCENLTVLKVDKENQTFDSRDNCNAIINTATNTLKLGCKSTIIPNTVTSIGEYAFSGCTGLTNIVIPSSVTSIGSIAFEGCTGLTSIEIPSSVTSIGSGAFWGCPGLTSIEIPSSVTSIGDRAFADCSSLTNVTALNSSPIDIYSSTFSNRSNATLYVPKGSKEAYEAASYWNEFKEIVELSNNLEITDGEVLDITQTQTCDELTYSRTFSSTQWQSLYVPFAIPVDSLTKQGLQVAELNDTHQWDLNGDGVADSTRVEFFTLTSGSTLANHPYLIRAQDAPKTFTLRMEDVEVAATEENSYECSSFKQRFTVVGTYAGVSGQEMWDNNYYGMSGGGLKRVSNATVSLKPQRWYMKVENKNGDPVTYYAASLRIAIDGIDEMPEATDIEMVFGANGEAVIYGIDGMRYRRKPSKPGLYVHDGKKIFIR